MTIQEIKDSFTICGLVCVFCSHKEKCPGCRNNNGNCDIKACCIKKGLNYCFECKDFPCDKDMYKSIRIRAFNTVAKTEGLEKLAEYLCKNYNHGIIYHRAGGLTGDYDGFKDEEGVIYMLKNGRPDPYDICPVYESERFMLRLVSQDDAADLLLCYSNPEAQVLFNSDNCTSDFYFSSVDEMKRCIDFWLDEYKNKQYVRFSIIDRKNDKAVGTVEIFNSDKKSGTGILRIDVHPQYENREHLGQLLSIADNFFNDFGCGQIVTKAVPGATERITALKNHGYTYYPEYGEWDRKDYYIKRNQ